MKRTAIVVAALVALAVTPAFAAKKAPAAKKSATACTSENIAKTNTAIGAMPDGPAKLAMAKEMGMVNADMSKGNMRGACAHYAKAQKMAGGK
ncbi:hypothetical protein [Bradyrhizobium sp.]|uniref:hypothetical protein n=1 Tax=Bradyrhizobium sp. TaxID=376 RepID=UPI0040376C62